MHLLLEVSSTALPDTILVFCSMAAPRPLWIDHHLPRQLTGGAAAPLLRPDSKVVERRADMVLIEPLCQAIAPKIA